MVFHGGISLKRTLSLKKKKQIAAALAAAVFVCGGCTGNLKEEQDEILLETVAESSENLEHADDAEQSEAGETLPETAEPQETAETRLGTPTTSSREMFSSFKVSRMLAAISSRTYLPCSSFLVGISHFFNNTPSTSKIPSLTLVPPTSTPIHFFPITFLLNSIKICNCSVPSQLQRFYSFNYMIYSKSKMLKQDCSRTAGTKALHGHIRTVKTNVSAPAKVA